MTAEPLITVIVPVYNGAATLSGCLEALFASQGVPFEVLVVDDGSTDGTADVARRYPCRLAALGRNEGTARAKNHGAEQARGAILFFTDADIHVPPDALRHVAEDFGDPATDGVVGLLAESCPHANFASQFKNLWMHYTYRRQPRRVGLFFTSAAAIRREIFVGEGGFDARYMGASITEDIELGQRLLGRGYTIVMDQRLTVEHHKRYRAGEVLRTDVLRARGLMQTWLRNRLSGGGRAHYASVPWFFGAAVGALGLATLAALVALILGSGWAWGASVALAVGALALNSPFLRALQRWRGWAFAARSAGFVLLDLFASGLGILLGLGDFVLGKRY
ncbi:MAG: glycosyltransferase family 2 protein [Chloroflexota bacterium]